MDITIKRVLISDEIDQKCVDLLHANGIEVVKNTKLAKQQLLEEIKNFDALVVRSATKVTKEVIEAGKRLKVIGRAGTGVDNIDCEAATKRGILVMNTPAGNTISAAEHTCTLICSLSRHVAQARASMVAGRWDRKLFMGNELMDKTLAIIGLGRIGREVAHRMQSFGMRTIGFDPIISAEESATFGVDWLPLTEIWPQADYITVHTPLIPQTKNLIGVDALAKCKPTVRIINVARGGIVDEAALLDALNAGQCGGAGLDVFLEEPPTNQDLVRHPKVVATPHLGASTEEAQSRVAVEIAEQFVDLSASRALNGAVNGQALAQALVPANGATLHLVDVLGRLARSLAPSGSAPVHAFLEPKSAAHLCRVVQAALASAMVKSDGADVNLISGPAAAKAAGVEVKVEAREGKETSIGVEVSVGDVTVKGTAHDDHSALLAVAGSHLRHPLLMAKGATLTVVEAPVADVAAAAAKHNVVLRCLTSDAKGKMTVVIGEAPVSLSGATSIVL